MISLLFSLGKNLNCRQQHPYCAIKWKYSSKPCVDGEGKIRSSYESRCSKRRKRTNLARKGFFIDVRPCTQMCKRWFFPLKGDADVIVGLASRNVFLHRRTTQTVAANVFQASRNSFKMIRWCVNPSHSEKKKWLGRGNFFWHMSRFVLGKNFSSNFSRKVFVILTRTL